MFVSGDVDTNCPVLDGLDQDDVAKVWVRSLGSISYDTQIGGATTVPSFEVLKVEILQKR